MDLKQLEAFVSVASLRSFKSAAEQLNLTQPAISSRISTLESEIDGALFVRNRHPVQLTDKAMEILPLAEQMLQISQNITPKRNNLKFPTGTVLRIGTNSSLVSTWLPTLLWKLHEELPMVSFELEINSSHRLGERMMRGELDISLMDTPPEAPGLKSQVVAVFDAIWAARPGVVENGMFDMARASETLFVTFRSESRVYSMVETGLRNAGVWPVAMMTTTSNAMIVEMLCSTGAIGTVTRQSIEQNIKDGTLEEIEVPIALPDSELSLSYPLTRRNDILRKAVDIMIHSVKGSSGSI